MTTTLLRSALVTTLAGGLLTLSPISFAAADDYPPSEPSATVEGVKVAPGTAVDSGSPDATGQDSSAPSVESSTAAALPRTGADVLVWTLAGGGLLVGGAAMVAGSRRRRTARH